MSWIANDYTNSPAFQFQKLGFDVWIANARGSKFSRVHTDKDKSYKTGAYWDFEQKEMAEDLQVFIEKILTENTHYSKLAAFIGHGNGANLFYIGNFHNSDWFKDRVELFFPLAQLTNQYVSTTHSYL
jgi:hypothetical protein